MNVLIMGATGMVGQGVLRECLHAGDVQQVITLGRTATGQSHAKLRDVVHPNLSDLSAIATEVSRVDACFFCLGVSSAGMSEADYAKLTYDLTLAVARALAALNPAITFVYVSGLGTDSSEHGRTMWARVKGKTENALLKLPFKAAFMFRPGLIIPMHGITSKTTLYRLIYLVLTPLYPLLERITPGAVTTTERVGRAMLAVARTGYSSPLVETADINALSAAPS